MKTIKFFTLGFLAISMLSCGGNSNSKGDDSTSVNEKDSINKEDNIHLPDTIFESVNAVDYKIQMVDSAISGQINNLKDLYADTPGAFTFRKGSKRNADFGGRITGTPSDLELVWTYKTHEDYTPTKLGSWGGGTGWTGQPLYVEWPDSVLSKMKQKQAVLPNFSGKEIMVGSLCGEICFIDFETGTNSREPIPVQNPIKGTISLDPTLNGNLYVGQGVPKVRPFGALGIDLFTNQIFDFFPEDSKALRNWGAYDSSAIRVGQFLYRPAENGGVYKFLVEPGKLTLHSVLRYRVKGAAPGIESSMAVYKNYGFVADNHGNIMAINLDNMTPVWHFALGDDTDATPVLEIENGVPYLYVGNEIDLIKSGESRFVKLNGLNGSVAWETKLAGRLYSIGNKHFDGGYYGTALLGNGNCKDMIFANFVENEHGQNGYFMAMKKSNGEIVYKTPLNRYAWSSPVGFLNENEEMYVVTGDCAGNLYLIKGIDGQIITSKPVGNNFESSPVVVGDCFVVGSRGNSIFKMRVK